MVSLASLFAVPRERHYPSASSDAAHPFADDSWSDQSLGPARWLDTTRDNTAKSAICRVFHHDPIGTKTLDGVAGWLGRALGSAPVALQEVATDIRSINPSLEEGDAGCRCDEIHGLLCGSLAPAVPLQ